MEEWRDIPGYENIYQASNFGRIRTAYGKTTSNARFTKRVWKQRTLKPKLQRRKNTDKMDARVSIWKDGKEKTFLVSRLVAMAWCPGYADELTVNHIDGNPLNNCADNLEWIPLAENIRQGFADGLYPGTCVVVVRDGDIEIYNSLSKASQAIGKNKGYLSTRIKRKTMGR